MALFVAAWMSMACTPSALALGVQGAQPVELMRLSPLPLSEQPVAARAPSATAGPARVYTSTINLLTYPVEPYQTLAVDPVFDWPYAIFDFERFEAESPEPVDRTYQTIVLENDYLRVTIAPELGGRVLQAVHKPTGARMFYENSVVKPTAWGWPTQRGWTAVGGLEWCLPVIEHGYAWGERWQVEIVQRGPRRVAVTLSTPRDGRALHAAITVALDAQEAAFTVQPRLTNLTDATVRFDYWHNAMFAPGDGHRVTRGLHFVFPTESMSVHSTADARLPAAGQRLTWPIFEGRDVSRLRTWAQYAGLFEWPAAHGPFAGVYDAGQDAGAVRVYPAHMAQGSKLFALGGSKALDPGLYTDDDGVYVEVHGGLAPTFAQQTALEARQSTVWNETWYPVVGIGDLAVANGNAALALIKQDGAPYAGVYAVKGFDGSLVLTTDNGEEYEEPLRVATGDSALVALPELADEVNLASVRLVDGRGRTLLEYLLER